MSSRNRQRRQRREETRRQEDARRQQDGLYEQRRNTSWVIRIGVATLVIAVTAIVVPLTIAGGSGDERSSGPSSTPSPSVSNALSGGLGGANIDLGCPAPTGPNNRPSLRIHVVEWCALDAVRGQAQMKFKVWIANTGTSDLDTTLDHFRLLIRTLDPTQWFPPEGLTASKLRPIQVLDEGVKVWAIPPNPDGAAEPIPGQPGVDTFATHWNLKTLKPGQQFTPTKPDVGDLVFYIPVAHGDATRLDGVLGLAYVDTDDHIAVVCPPSNWGPRKPADTF